MSIIMSIILTQPSPAPLLFKKSLAGAVTLCVCLQPASNAWKLKYPYGELGFPKFIMTDSDITYLCD